MTLALALLLALCLCACNQTPEESVVTEFTFPEGTSILDINVSGMNRDAGWKAVQDAVSDYSLTINVDGVEATVTAAEIGLTCSGERYNAIADAVEVGATPEFTGLISFNEGKLRALVNTYFNKDVTEAAIVFDEAAGEYILIPDDNGQNCNPNAIVDALRQTVCDLAAQHTLTDVSQILEPELRDEDEAIIQALQTVNKMNNVELTYSFTADGKTSTEAIPAETIRSFISLGPDNVTPGINYSILEAYVAELSENHSAGSTTGPFIATGGGSVGLNVTYNGVYLDQDAMTEDIATCILEGISGTRSAPFQASGIRDMPYGGTYIEINLSSQHLWFYKNGECILSTSLVSGKVSAGYNTPTGVFSIYSKSTDTYLEGEDYRSFVNYWMPFYGGYGLHDATWRGSFGGEIYLYNGSHGCVNLPLSSASTIYANAPVGTKVILYGGTRSVPAQPQSLSGTTSYSVADDVGTITLNIKPRYSGPKMSYVSSDPSVASVNSSGVVTINSIGNATITVSVPAQGSYTSATTTVSISVHSPCDEGRHTLGTPTVTEPATCQPGKQSVACTKCTYTTIQEIPAKDSHSYGSWSVVTAATCGTNGQQVRTCTNCGIATQTEDISATGLHTPGTPVTTKAPTCRSKGTTETRCTVCNTVTATGELDIVATNHTAGDPKITAATCTQNGKKETFCIHCNELMSSETIPASHVPGDWYTVVAATCKSEGMLGKKCTVCGSEVDQQSTSKVTHSYSGGVCIYDCGTAEPASEPASNGEG